MRLRTIIRGTFSTLGIALLVTTTASQAFAATEGTEPDAAPAEIGTALYMERQPDGTVLVTERGSDDEPAPPADPAPELDEEPAAPEAPPDPLTAPAAEEPAAPEAPAQVFHLMSLGRCW